MPNKSQCWTYEDITEFLKAKSFEFYEDVEGFGNGWISFKQNGEPNRIVKVPYIELFCTPKQFLKMVNQSGFPEDQWHNWRAG
jgi:hypothetical protein